MPLILKTLIVDSDVLEVIGQWRRVDLQDLERETGLSRFALRQRVNQLIAKNLIAEVPAPIDDFTMFFLTPEGVRECEHFDDVRESEAELRG